MSPEPSTPTWDTAGRCRCGEHVPPVSEWHVPRRIFRRWSGWHCPGCLAAYVYEHDAVSVTYPPEEP